MNIYPQLKCVYCDEDSVATPAAIHDYYCRYCDVRYFTEYSYQNKTNIIEVISFYYNNDFIIDLRIFNKTTVLHHNTNGLIKKFDNILNITPTNLQTKVQTILSLL